ncbi:hypothetical protein LIA77_00531 [Sarocladium implicatum]|nr:hypothetical protein LIA77_00531 [Sarocladium implicatum]
MNIHGCTQPAVHNPHASASCARGAQSDSSYVFKSRDHSLTYWSSPHIEWSNHNHCTTSIGRKPKVDLLGSTEFAAGYALRKLAIPHDHKPRLRMRSAEMLREIQSFESRPVHTVGPPEAAFGPTRRQEELNAVAIDLPLVCYLDWVKIHVCCGSTRGRSWTGM